MDPVRNPYAPGAGTPPPELAGRADIISSAETALKRAALARSVQSSILVGLRGVGKTVLLVRIEDIAKKLGYMTIFIEAHEGKSLPELLIPGIKKALIALDTLGTAKETAKRGLRVLRSFIGAVKIKVEGIEYGLSIAPEKGTADSGDLEADLSELLLSLGEAARSSATPIAILVDELQNLAEKEFSALIMAIHRLNQKSHPLILIGAGLPQIIGLAGNSKSYAERLFRFPEIGALHEKDAEAALVSPAKAVGVRFENSAVAQILKVTERYPYFLQQWAHEAWNIADGDIIRAADVFTAHNNAIAELDKSFFKVRFDRCTPAEKAYMRAMSELGNGSHRSGDIATMMGVKTASVAPVRGKLIKKGMIYSPSFGDTLFTVPLFGEYMKRTMAFKKRSARKAQVSEREGEDSE
ncbi:MAG: AAA family ATPase [Xanthobacteraceae bacterium]|nr:AAA family ATPase [Xanthobacteraceae bacterium]